MAKAPAGGGGASAAPGTGCGSCWRLGSGDGGRAREGGGGGGGGVRPPTCCCRRRPISPAGGESIMGKQVGEWHACAVLPALWGLL